MKRIVALVLPVLLLSWISGCPGLPGTAMDDGPVAPNISAKMGEPIPSATADQLAAFERGKAVFQKRFDLAEGLGPAFNVTFCAGCHERPTLGGSAGLYRNFFLAGRVTVDGAFINSESAGDAGGVLRVYNYGGTEPARPGVPETTTIFAQRNPIPIFGAGLLAELSDASILANADPTDADGDGISGRANFDRGFVGRFGRKAQVVSIEGFIRGPLFNHMGITTDPLTELQRSQLPVDSSAVLASSASAIGFMFGKHGPHMQAAAPDGPTTDDDGAPDPEMTGDELFDLVSFTMLLGAPQLDTPTEQSNRGRLLFHSSDCSACHVPRLNGPRGPLPLYSDLLLHDMGSDLADGIVQGEASGMEFRTQPLWGLAAVGPYLHDGRAETIEDAILAHGGEAQGSRDTFAALSIDQQGDLIEFLMSLGGRDQFSTGLLEPGAPILTVGEYGGPLRELTLDEAERFVRGRELFDRDFGHATGAGSPRFNGDSCRACHFDPVIGGSGPRGVSVMRHGIIDAAGDFIVPSVGTILHKATTLFTLGVLPQNEANMFEIRQSPSLLGLGLIDQVADATILALADANDEDGDGISGRVSITDGGRVGRMGWKAQVPSIAEFVRDAMAAEIGLTVEIQPGLTFGKIDDNDDVDDPELSAVEAEDLAFFITTLAPPPRQPILDTAQVDAGVALFGSVGCTKCHVPDLDDAIGLYSDLLLHEILALGVTGIEDTSANMREFRTAPLWGLSQTAPYFHDGAADTIDAAIRMHDGEATAIRDVYVGLSDSDRQALLAFLESL